MSQLLQRGVQGRLAQLLPGPLPRLLGQMALEGNGLLKVERLKVPIPVVLLKPAQGLRGGVHGGLAVALGFFQID